MVTLSARALLLSAIVLASVAPALGATDARSRVTIRGNGRTFSLERRGSDVGPLILKRAARPDAVGEAVRLKKQGVNDATVLAYLRAHQADLPPVIDVEDVRRLRGAGAGKSVTTFLASVAAVGVGETGEGHPSAEVALPAVEPAETTVYGAPYGYPTTYGGYPMGRMHRFGGRGLAPHRGVIIHPRAPIFRKVAPRVR